MLAGEVVTKLHRGWQRYRELFCVPPHGTRKQLAALVTLSGFTEGVYESVQDTVVEDQKRAGRFIDLRTRNSKPAEWYAHFLMGGKAEVTVNGHVVPDAIAYYEFDNHMGRVVSIQQRATRPTLTQAVSAETCWECSEMGVVAFQLLPLEGEEATECNE